MRRANPPSARPDKRRPTSIDREAVFAGKRAIREAAIERLIQDEKANGVALAPFLARISYDLHHAPMTTNLAQLAEIGIHPPAAEVLADEDLGDALATVIDGLASLGVFLRGTDHLTDRRLYIVLCTRVLVEEVRDVPPCADMSEFIDLESVAPHEMEGEGDGDGDGRDLATAPPFPAVVERDGSLPMPKRS
jgi:hypothetical protein